MKTIGLIGGLSWESSALYYQLINRAVQASKGGLHSAKILMYSFNFQEIASLQHDGNWKDAGRMLAEAARKLELGGAEGIAICSNTMHKTADMVCAATSVPFIHIGDATAWELQKKQVNRAALLGTAFTMEQNFYKQSLKNSGIDVLIPQERAREQIHRIIFDELCRGEIRESSRQTLLEVIDSLKDAGAQGTVLGCTELPMLVNQADTEVPLFDTTRIHADAIAAFCLEK